MYIQYLGHCVLKAVLYDKLYVTEWTMKLGSTSLIHPTDLSAQSFNLFISFSQRP